MSRACGRRCRRWSTSSAGAAISGVEGVKSAGYALLVTYPKGANPEAGAVAMAQRSSAARSSVALEPQLAATPTAPVSRPGKSEYRSPHCRLDKCDRLGTASLLAHAQPRREPKRWARRLSGVWPPCMASPCAITRVDSGSHAARGRRRFPPPRTLEDNGACFIVRDLNGKALAYVYFEQEPGRRTAANLLTRDEARRIAPSLFRRLSITLIGQLADCSCGRISWRTPFGPLLPVGNFKQMQGKFECAL